MIGGARTRRLFVGLAPPAELSRELHARCAPLLVAPELAPVAAADLHATLVFLGTVGDEVADELAAALRRALAPSARFALAFQGCGAFPRERDARVVWCGVRDEPAGTLHALYERAHGALVEAGMRCEPLEPRERWVPHITLARRRRDAGRRIDAAALLGALAEVLPSATWTVAEAALFESLGGASAGARYTARAHFPVSG